MEASSRAANEIYLAAQNDCRKCLNIKTVGIQRRPENRIGMILKDIIKAIENCGWKLSFI